MRVAKLLQAQVSVNVPQCAATKYGITRRNISFGIKNVCSTFKEEKCSLYIGATSSTRKLLCVKCCCDTAAILQLKAGRIIPIDQVFNIGCVFLSLTRDLDRKSIQIEKRH